MRLFRSLDNYGRILQLFKVHAIKGRVLRLSIKNDFIHRGYCPICEKSVTFYCSSNKSFRDYLFCSGCGSIPRERALMKVIQDLYPNFMDLDIHESSPGARGASIKLYNKCKNYTASQYYSHIPLGHIHPKSGYRSENLENLTFADNCFDIFITQDVMEHIFNPEMAFKEIARVLKPGGAHIFTVPLVRQSSKSVRCAQRTQKGNVIFLREPEYHGNPVNKSGALVTMEWGRDIAEFITEKAQTPTRIININNIKFGIRAEYIDVLVSIKKEINC
jgi:SAM-dependent methyltransferase